MASERGTRTFDRQAAEDSGSDRSTLCIVLANEGGPLSPEVHAAIAACGWQTIELHDPLEAMLRLCLLERMQLTRAGWGLPRLQNLAILLISPVHRAVATQVSQAIHHHLPEIDIWAFDSGNGMIRQFADTKKEAQNIQIRLSGGQSIDQRDIGRVNAVDSARIEPHESPAGASRSTPLPFQFPTLRQVAEVRHDMPAEPPPEIRPRVAAKDNEQSAPEDDIVVIEEPAITRQEIAMLLEMENHEADV